MSICPSCKHLNAAEAEACPVCGVRLIGSQRVSSDEMATVRSLGTPPQASLPAPMVEPIVPVPIDPDASSPSGTALTRGLSDDTSDIAGSQAMASVITVREPGSVRHAPPTTPGPAGPEAHTVPPTEPRLVVVRGERLNAEFPILEGRNYVGRCAERPVDIDLDGQEMIERIWTSRQHAVLTWDHAVLVIEDLNSLNGTFVNRARIHPGHRHALQAGDVIQIGTVQMRVVL